MRILTKTLCNALLVCSSANLLAFDGKEHERVSDMAILLAWSAWLERENASYSPDTGICDYLEDHFNADGVVTLVRHCPEQIAEAKPVSPTPQAADSSEPDFRHAATYGGLVRLVDETLYPTQIFAREGVLGKSGELIGNKGRDYVISFRDLNWRFNRRREIRRGSRVFNTVLEGYRALAYNQVHFQNDLQQQLKRFRREALVAAQSGELYHALVTNALADHFLQDFLAPGHILWPRNHSHDSVAISVHDGTNQKGAALAVSSDYWQSLIPLVEHISALQADSRVRERMREYWLKRKRNARVGCDVENAETTKLVGTPQEGLDCLTQVIERGEDLPMFGDGLLSKSPGQQMLMVLTHAERIIDLLEQYALARSSESVLDDDPTAENGMNEDVYDDIIYSFDAGYKTLLVPCARQELGAYRFKPSDECDEKYKYSGDVFKDTAAGVFLVGLGGQAPFREVGSSRFQASLEYLPLDLMANVKGLRNAAVHKPPAGCKTWSPCNFGFAVGLDYITDNQFDAFGGGVRMIKAFPSINLQLSPYVKVLEYRFSGDSNTNLSWGVRADWGFSIGSFYITAGKEYFVNDQVQLQSTGMVSFGIGFGVPNSRLRKWLVDNRRYSPVRDY